MKNIGAMMKQAQQMQAKMQEMQARLAEVEVSGQSGAGMVNVTVNGKGELKKVKLDKAVVDPEDVEVLEDLIVAAFNDAKSKVERQVAEETQKLMGGLSLPPGFKLPF
ncbi:YbaB/EbfC family nucleoid-associated protein [Azospirillum thermophilum]|uniref:Nucleoid-associated protein DEW08_15590 n=1 Tax=Azospirillum thermophilum TaxID=2202148 RepID=A0A2S2CSQ7_9PROT|nr:YbaB/EbfC family nucleoid-associated protein [Azospirillum thermophilum]AWK87455.1 YbaB/EbfC family nucleoid-associated protein [Azospirillum thermophilum]